MPADIAKIERLLAGINDLMRSDGWKILQGYLQGQKAEIIMHLGVETDPVKLARLGGQLHLVNGFEAWPGQQAHAFERQITSFRELQNANADRK